MCRSTYDKIPALLNDCRQLGLTVCPPDINESQEGFTSSGDKIIFGFNDIKGVGNAGAIIVAERNENGKYHSFKNMITRLLTYENASRTIPISAYTALIEGGTMDAFCNGNRTSLLSHLEEFNGIAKKLKGKQDQLEATKKEYGNGQDTLPEKELKHLLRLISDRERALNKITSEYNSFVFDGDPDDMDSKLKAEYERLGAYITGSPLDKYDASIKKVKNRTDIADMDDIGNIIFCGMVIDVKMLTRKKDGKQFCVFVLMDKTGETEVKCFVREYEQFAELIKPGAALIVNGKTHTETGFDDEEKVTVTTVSIARLAATSNVRLMIYCDSLLQWNQYAAEIRVFRDDMEGFETYVHDRSTNEVRRLKYKVSPQALSAKTNLLIKKI